MVRKAVVQIIGCSMVMMVAFASAVQAEHMYGFGIHGGLNFGTALVDPDVNQSFKVGPELGVVGDMQISDPWYFEYEVNWLRNGASIELGGVDADVTLDYLEIPLRVKWLWNLDAPLIPFAFAGLNVGFILNANGDADAPIVNFQENLDDDFTTFDLGADLGIGLAWDLNETIRLSLRGRYTPWFFDVLEDDNSLGLDSWHNQDIKLDLAAVWLFGAQPSRQY